MSKTWREPRNADGWGENMGDRRINGLHYIALSQHLYSPPEHQPDLSFIHSHTFIHQCEVAAMQGAALPHWEQFQVKCLAQGHDDGLECNGIETADLSVIGQAALPREPQMPKT